MSAASDKQDRANLFTFLILLAVFLPLTVKLAAPYLLSLFLGAILALVSGPVYHRLRARGWPAGRAALVVSLAGVLLIIAPVTLFLSKALQEGAAAAQDLAKRDDLSFSRVLHRLSEWGPTSQLLGSGDDLERQLRSSLQSTGRAVSAVLLKVLASLPVAALQLGLACLAWFFMLRDGERFVGWLVGKLPLDEDVRQQLVESLKTTALSTVWATLSAAAAQATVMAVGFAALGIPAAFLAWGATFILSWFPIVGSVPVSMGGVIYLYAQHEYTRMGLMVGVGVLVTLVDNVVRPLVLKGRQDLHPFVGLLAVVAGIDLFGLLGAFVGPIIVSLAISLLNLWPVVAHRFGFSVHPQAATVAWSKPSPELEPPRGRLRRFAGRLAQRLRR